MPYRKMSVKLAKQTVVIMKALDDLYSRYGGGFEASRLFHANISRTPVDILNKMDGVKGRTKRHEHTCTQPVPRSESGHYQYFARREHSYGGKRRARDESFHSVD